MVTNFLNVTCELSTLYCSEALDLSSAVSSEIDSYRIIPVEVTSQKEDDNLPRFFSVASGEMHQQLKFASETSSRCELHFIQQKNIDWVLPEKEIRVPAFHLVAIKNLFTGSVIKDNAYANLQIKQIKTSLLSDMVSFLFFLSLVAIVCFFPFACMGGIENALDRAMGEEGDSTFGSFYFLIIMFTLVTGIVCRGRGKTLIPLDIERKAIKDYLSRI